MMVANHELTKDMCEGDDYSMADEYISGWHEDEEDIYGRVAHFTHDRLVDWWPEVECLATALTHVGNLDGDICRQIISTSLEQRGCSTEPQHALEALV